MSGDDGDDHAEQDAENEPTCPKCGTPITSVAASSPERVVLSPCGHELPVGCLSERRDTDRDEQDDDRADDRGASHE